MVVEVKHIRIVSTNTLNYPMRAFKAIAISFAGDEQQ